MSLYSLSIQSEIPYSTLSDIKNNKVQLDHISIGTFRRMASVFSMTLDDLYEELTKPDSFIKTQADYPVSKRLYNKIVKLRIPISEYQIEGQFVLEDDTWNLIFTYRGKCHCLPFDGIISNERYSILQDLGAFQIENYLHDLLFQEQAESVIIDGKY